MYGWVGYVEGYVCVCMVMYSCGGLCIAVEGYV